MLIFDAHLDLSFSAIAYNRDLRRSVTEIRAREQGMNDLGGRGRGTVAFPEMRRGGVGICVATLIAGCMKPAAPMMGGWDSPEQAWAMTQAQVAWYRAMEQDGQLRQITSWPQLQQHIDDWNIDPDTTPIGYIMSLEGADSIVTVTDLQRSYDQGLRALGPAHYGIGRYAHGHDQQGGLSALGKDLLIEMNRLGMILDVTHLCEQTFWDSLEIFPGHVWASHHNCRALVDDPRQLSDDQIKALAQRDAVIGVALDVWMVAPGWHRGQTTHADVDGADFEGLANHIDHICQLLGSTRSVGIGTDLDGGFGTEQSPADLDSIADLDKLFAILDRRGYCPADLSAICHGNFLALLERAWS